MTLLERVVSVFTPARETNREATNQEEEAGRPGQGTPACQPENDDCNTNHQRLRGIESGRIGGFRDVDGHESWRDVARSCHVDPQGHE